MGVSQEDMELAEEVRKYPALYDKKCLDFHRKDVASNCWGRVRLILGLESAAIAKKEFDLLRKRFNNVRKKKVVAGVSGTSRQEMLLKIGDVEGYEFLTWLVPFITLRTTKSNVVNAKNSAEDANVLLPVTLLSKDDNEEDYDFDNSYVMNSSIIINSVPADEKEAGFSGNTQLNSSVSSSAPPEQKISDATGRKKWKKQKREPKAEIDLTAEEEIN